MAYNNGFPVNYQQMYPQYVPSSFQPQMMQQQPQTTQPVNDTGILWVQGEAGAKSFAVAPGKSVMLMDSETHSILNLLIIVVCLCRLESLIIPNVHSNRLKQSILFNMNRRLILHSLLPVKNLKNDLVSLFRGRRLNNG